MPALAQDPDISFQKFVLSNGLTLVVHEDHKAPIVSVDVWYHVGSKNERPGKTGFAHLFEHLMFGGSEHFKQRYIGAMERLGATDLNGTTNEDRTNYFETVPVSALDQVLWLESDRMGYMVGAIDQQTLDLQRGVVQNEKRQDENEPYGQVEEIEQHDTYPAGHPYSWSTIGSMEDLNAASLTDVKDWFKTYYGPSNAVLVVAGDIDPATVHQKVEKYFGEIPPGPPIERPRVWIAKMSGAHRASMQDRVPLARVDKIWNMPEFGNADSDYLDLVSDVLGAGKTSRLYKRLVYDDQIATQVGAFVNPREIGGQFFITATARPGVDLARLEKAVDEEVARFLKDGPTQEELERVRTQYMANFLRGVDRIGGFGGTSDVLAQSQVYLGDAGAYKTKLARVREATPAKLREAAARWLSDGVYTMEIYPYGDLKPSSETVDRTKLPEAGQPPEPRLPKLERTTLSNGLQIVLAERHELPLVNFSLMVDSGYAADQFASPGTAKLEAALLDGGTKTHSSLELNEQLAQLGARVSTQGSMDYVTVRLSALKAKLDASLDLYGDLILNPVFPDADFRRQQQLQLSAIRQEMATPAQMGLRVLPGLIYGKGHAYAEPFTGSGTPQSVAKLTRADLVKFHDTWFKPNHSTLVIVGDTTLAEIRPELEKVFAAWKPGETPKKNLANVSLPAKPVVYLVDRPGSEQSLILAGSVAPRKTAETEIPIEAMNNVLGGDFAARINSNLREDKHWSYGAQTVIPDVRGERLFLVYAPVQTDKTKESLAEISKEFRGIVGDRPATAAELARVKTTETLRLPGSQETMAQVSASIEELIRCNLPDNYHETYASKVRELTLADVNKAAAEVVHPDQLVWVIVGDRSKVESGVKELGLGTVQVLNPE
ncbi:MAG TPA: pitrilysin family protein [Bryobacteraceae bacterium]